MQAGRALAVSGARLPLQGDVPPTGEPGRRGGGCLRSMRRGRSLLRARAARCNAAAL